MEIEKCIKLEEEKMKQYIKKITIFLCVIESKKKIKNFSFLTKQLEIENETIRITN